MNDPADPPPRRNLIVIPAFNEEASLAGTLAAVAGLADGYDVVVVDDGSTDRTTEVADRTAARLDLPVHVARLGFNGGIGVAVQTGYQFAAARGGYEYVIQCDADGQHDPADIPRLVAECEKRGLDLCVGSRFLAADGAGYRSTFSRRLGIRFFVGLIGLLAGVRATDPTSGLRCAGPRAWRRFARQYPEDYPEPESLFWCARSGLRVGELPVRMRERAGGTSSIRSWRTVYYMAKVTLAILIDRVRGTGA